MLIQGDCLEVMKDLEPVDLIYADPPFNTGRDFGAFNDKWDDYLGYMVERLKRMKDILKNTGSIYLHCDHTMSHYLKVEMDKIFGRKNFRNEIVWKRYSSHNDAKRYRNTIDTIYYYSKTKNFVFNADDIKEPLDPEYVKKSYCHKDKRGVYQTSCLTVSSGHSGKGYKYDFHGHFREWLYPEYSMKKLEDDNRIHFPKKIDGIPKRKKFLHENKGMIPNNLWTDIKPVWSGKEKNGYPTQKPIALLERIIKASSNEGDTVLDPFCGSGTTLVAAKKLNRKDIGIDISETAIEICKERLDGLRQPNSSI